MIGEKSKLSYSHLQTGLALLITIFSSIIINANNYIKLGKVGSFFPSSHPKEIIIYCRWMLTHGLIPAAQCKQDVGVLLACSSSSIPGDAVYLPAPSVS